ncbi:MAG: MATE family efflux transporter [Candidatus Eiseniibacteriota bacterium]
MTQAVDPTRGPLLPALLRLAGPIVIMQLSHTLFHVIDVMWVGRLGAAATAGVTASYYFVWMLWSLNDITAVSVAATVARHIGARERDKAAYGVAQAALLAVVLGAVVTVIGLSVDRVYALVGASPEVHAIGVGFLRYIFAGAIITFLFGLSESTLRAAGDTRTPMIVVASSLALNAILTPLLVFGPGPLPALGASGAGLATVLAQLFAVVWFATLALRGHPAFPFDFAALRRVSAPYVLALVRVGLPFSLMGLLFSAVYVVLARIAARVGTEGLAVLGIGNRVESLAYLVAVGMSLACEAVVGQNLGAREPRRAERAAWLSSGIMAAFALVISVVMWAVPEALVGFFTNDAEVVRLGVPYLRVLAACQAFSAIEIVMNGAFAGAGDTMPPMLITGVLSTLRIPLAFWLCIDQGLGALGLAWTITVTCIGRGALLAYWFHRGAWKTKALATADALRVAHPLPPPDPQY